MHDTTERPEPVEAGLPLGNIAPYKAVAFAHNPSRDVFARECIAQMLLAGKSLFRLAPSRPGGAIPVP